MCVCVREKGEKKKKSREIEYVSPKTIIFCHAAFFFLFFARDLVCGIIDDVRYAR